MISSMISMMLIALNAANAQSIVGKDCPNFQPCLNVNDLYKTGTCDPLQSKNASWYGICICLNNINIGYCYNQCTSDPLAVSQGAAFQATIISSCSAFNINSKGPFPQAPWVGSVLSSDMDMPAGNATTTQLGATGTVSTSSLGTATELTTASTTALAVNNAQKLLSSLAGLIVMLCV